MAKIGQPRVSTSVTEVEQPKEPFDLSILPMLLYFMMQNGGLGGGGGENAPGTSGLGYPNPFGAIPPDVSDMGLGQLMGGLQGPMAPPMAPPMQPPAPSTDTNMAADPMSFMKFLGFM